MISRVVIGVKEQKTVQNDKVLSVALHTQEPYIIWLSFIVHMCKIIISPGVYFIFSKFWFSGLLGGGGGVKGQKKFQHHKKFCPTPFLRNHTSYDCHLWYTSVKWWYLHCFFHFFRLLLWWKDKKWPKVTKNSVTLHISGTIHHMIVLCGTQGWNDNIFNKILIFRVVRRVKGQSFFKF